MLEYNTMLVNRSVTLSVIIPTRDRPNQLIRLLDSILAQKTRPFEVIVVDNGTHGLNHKILSLYCRLLHLKILREHKIGEARARNRGIQLAKGDIIAMVDDDCVVGDNWITNILTSHTHGEFVVQGVGKEHPHSQNIYSYIHNLRSEEGYEYALSMSSGSIQAGGATRPIISLIDTKNVSFPRSLTKKIIPWYEDTLPSYAFANDISVVKKLTQLHIPIIYNPDIVVYHSGRSTLLTFLTRSFEYGKCDYWVRVSLNNQSLMMHDVIRQFDREIKNHARWSVFNTVLIDMKLFRTLMRHNSFIYVVRLYGILVFVLAKGVRFSGYLYEKHAHS